MGELIQSSAWSAIYYFSLLIRVVWSIASKVGLRSSKANIVHSPE